MEISHMNGKITAENIFRLLQDRTLDPGYWQQLDQQQLIEALGICQQAWLDQVTSRQKAIIDLIPNAIWSAEPDGTVDFLNQAWLDYAGMRADEALGGGWLKAVHPDEMAQVQETWHDIISRQQGGELFFRLRRHDGQYRIFLTRVQASRDTAGHIVKWYGTNIDITEHKETETRLEQQRKQLEESEERFRLLYETNMDAVLITRPDGTILSANPAAEQLFACSEAEICRLGRNGLIDLADPRLPAALAERSRQGYFKGELNFRRLDGSVFPAELYTIMFTDSQGQKKSSMSIRDISARKQAEKALQEERELFSTTIACAAEGIFVTDARGKIILMNPTAEIMAGLARETVLGKQFSELFKSADGEPAAPDARTADTTTAELDYSGPGAGAPHASTSDGNRNREWDLTRDVLRTGQRIDINKPVRLIRPDQANIYITGTFAPILAGAQRVTGVVVTIRDTSKEYMLQMEIEGFLNVNLDMLCVSDLQGNFVKVNRKFEQVLGYCMADLEGHNFMSFIHPDDIEAALAALSGLGEHEPVSGFINRYRCKDGSYKYIAWETLPGVGQYIYSSARDVTEKILYEEKLKALASRDALTGLYNRHHFDKVITDQIEHADRYNEPLSFFLFDLDLFKRVNDLYGHQVGDEVLKQTARIAEKTLRNADMIFRVGGEEFLVLLPQTSIGGAAVAAEKLRTVIESTRFPVVGRQTISIGVSERLKAESLRHWFRRTDDALYLAKQRGRNQVVDSSGNEKMPLAVIRLDWQPEWESGHDTIDSQHRALVDIANDLFSVFLSDTGHERIISQLDLLLQHIIVHFKTEEDILRKIGYVNYEQHAQIHEKLLAKALRLKDAYLTGDVKASAFFSFVVDDVILDHMVTADAEFFPFTRGNDTCRK